MAFRSKERFRKSAFLADFFDNLDYNRRM